jgi:threonine dehydratase
MIGLDDVIAARDRIAGHVRVTPVMALTGAREPLPLRAEVVAKLELHQVTGSFKARGAMSLLASLTPEEVARGIVAASGGNHGMAVARAARVAGEAARIYVPSNVAPAKVAAMEGWGATVTVAGDEFATADAAARADAAATGATYFHPFADPRIVAGQGTLGLELIGQAGEFDTLVVAIGGGGLVAGIGTVMRALRPGVRIVGVEPKGSPTLAASLEAGRAVTLDAVTSRIPTLSCRRTDGRIVEVAQRVIDDIVLLGDDEMLGASRWLWREFGIAADLAGAAATAVLRSGAAALAPARRVCVLVCGSGLEGTTAAPG